MKKILLFLFVLSSYKSFAYERVISTSPAFTEIIYQLGAESKLVGVSSYCQFPEAAKKLVKVGSPFDFDLEKAMRLKSDLVLLAKTKNEKIKNNLHAAGIDFLELQQESMLEIFSSIEKIGEKLDKKKEATSLIQNMKNELFKYRLPEKLKGQRVLVIIGHRQIEKGFEQIFVMESKTFYQDIIKNLGLENAASDKNGSPLWSTETLQRVNPDIIIDILSTTARPEVITEYWLKNYQSLNAIKTKNIFVFSSDYALIPGPRITNLAKDIYQKLLEIN